MPFPENADAIRNFGGIETLYYKHLKKFQSNYKYYISTLNKYIDQHEYEEAQRIAHSLKGLTSTLGLYLLEEKIEHLELALKEGRYNDLPTLLSSTKAEVDQMLYPSRLHSSSSVGTGLSGI